MLVNDSKICYRLTLSKKGDGITTALQKIESALHETFVGVTGIDLTFLGTAVN